MRHYLKIILTAFITVTVTTGAIDLLNLVTSKVPILDKIQTSVTDYDITDIIFSERKSNTKDSLIYLINFEHADRDTIGLLIKRLSEGEIRAIGLNAIFGKPKDAKKDSILMASLGLASNVILPCKWRMTSDSSAKCVESDTTTIGNNNRVSGYSGGSISENDFIEDYYGLSDRVIRKFLVYEDMSKKFCFECEITKEYNKEKFDKLVKRRNTQFINYYSDTTGFKVFSYKEILNVNFDLDQFKNKIVLIGFLGYRENDSRNSEGKWVTPLNRELLKNKAPDTYELVVQANIIKMIVNEDYINSLSLTQQGLIGEILLLLIVILFEIKLIENLEKRIRLICYCSLIFLYTSSIAALYFFNFKIDFRFVTIYLVVFPEVYLFYKAKFLPKISEIKKKWFKRPTHNNGGCCTTMNL